MLTLVTGATGQVGRRFVPRLLARATTGGAHGQGDQVRVLVRDGARAAPLADLGAQVVAGDIQDTEVLGEALAGVDSVVNLAASFRGVPDEEAWAVNRDAALELGRAAVRAGVRRFVQASTNVVYGTGRGRPHTEDDLPVAGGPLWGAYAESKGEAERGLLGLAGLDVRVGRLAFVYGAGDPHLTQVMRWAREWAAAQRLQMVHHADVAQGLLRLLFAPGIDGRVYNIADDAPVTTVDLYTLSGLPVPEDLRAGDAEDPWSGIVSTERIRRELGYRPLYPSVWVARDAGVL
ncbi:NAD-dependent epimerase/dehydratase family protein [Streptomyces aurantiacus]|uniref:NAD-dependent epimerase/dehydratase family protein n=1 Tax=Streptomyces aurantiacus TaxID=47760 RepID=UPI0006E16B87|nr:NAD(P)-dependent oxidoreductase [Streptomyces aurantiacus]